MIRTSFNAEVLLEHSPTALILNQKETPPLLINQQDATPP